MLRAAAWLCWVKVVTSCPCGGGDWGVLVLDQRGLKTTKGILYGDEVCLRSGDEQLRC